MISKMTKYDFILLSGQSEDFLQKLQELGVVDIARSQKPVDDKSSAMLEKILKIRRAIAILENLNYKKDADLARIREAAASIQIEGCKMENTLAAVERLSQLKGEIALAEKVIRGTEPWGEFNPQAISELKAKGIDMHFYCVSSKKFDASWAEDKALQVISEEDGLTWFVVASAAGSEYSFPIDEMPAPSIDIREAAAQFKALRLEEVSLKAKLLALKENHLPHMQKGLERKTADLDRYLASTRGNDAAEGYICTYTGFAPVEEDQKLKEAFDAMDILYISEEAMEEDNPPIKLKNSKFASLFECLTGMYGMPVYGEWDPTPILSIFFLLFFAMCMGDAGYGVILIIYGILQDKKIVNIGMFDGLGKLIAVLGVATTIVGFFLGTAFGVNLSAQEWIPEALRNMMLVGDVTVGGSSYALQMVLALGIGVFHLCLAMTIKAVLYTQRFGFKENISTWGWLLLILGGIIVGILAAVGLLPASATQALIIGIGALSALAIFIFNTPGRNPLLNIGAGLWDTYNMATGILGDVLSYIRLYALGLAGGMLGNAFNNLGNMVLGGDPASASWQWLPFVLILLFGHVLNLLMSCLGAFVHPLRLTFVEYFKNSGYEGKGRIYNALKK